MIQRTNKGTLVVALLLLPACSTGPSGAGHRPNLGTSDALGMASVVYFDKTFEDSSLAPFVLDADGGRCSISEEQVHSGTKSVKCTNHGKWSITRLKMVYPAGDSNPPVSQPTGLYQRFWVYVPQATIQHVTGPKNGQVKLLLNRYVEGGPSWLMCGTGTEFNARSGTLACPRDYGIHYFRGSHSRLALGDKWHKIETFYIRRNGVGTARYWVDGVLKGTHSSQYLGGDDSALNMQLWVGVVYTQNSKGPVVVYVDDIAAGNGYVDEEGKPDGAASGLPQGQEGR